MLIAHQKRKENIIEFLLYMYQIEDLVRSFQCDESRINADLIPGVLPNPSFKLQYESWYSEICKELIRSAKQRKGHLYELEEILTELKLLHRTLLDILKDQKYIDLLEVAKNDMEEFAQKSSLINAHPIDICLHAMHMKLQFKLRKQSLSKETEMAMDSMRVLLAYLGREYQRMKSGHWGMNLN